MACRALCGDEAHDVDSDKLIALVGAEVYTMVSDQPISEAVVLIRGSRIIAVAPEINVPEGATRIEADGLSITPGFIDAHSRLWLTPASSTSSASDASLNVLDGIDTFSEDWLEVIDQGVTTVCVQPSGAGTTGGFGVVLTVAPANGPGPALIAENTALQASIGVNAANNRIRLQQYERIQKLLEKAAEYKDKWDKYNKYLNEKNEKEKESKQKADSEEAGQTEGSRDDKDDDEATGQRRPVPQSGLGRGPRGGGGGRGRGPGPERAEQTNRGPTETTDKSEEEKKTTEEKPPEKPERDPLLEQLTRVLRGEIPIRLEVHTPDDFFYARKLIEDFEELQLIFEGLTRPGAASREFRQLAAPVVLGPWLELESNYRSEPDSASTWGNVFHDYTGNFVIASRGTTPRSSRFLRAHMAKAIASGISPENALRAVTCNAARLLGQAAELGTIETGKRADLVAFRGSPTDASTPIAWVMSQGEQVYSDTSAVDVEAVPLAQVSGKQLLDAVPGLQNLSELSRLPEVFSVTSERCLLADGTFAARTLVIDSGEIIDVLEPSAVNAKTDFGHMNFDLGSAVVTPGLFSGHTTLGLAQSIDPNSSPDASYIVAGDALSKGFKGERELLKDGLLRVILAPGNSNPIAGSASLIRVGANRPVAVRQVASKLVLNETARSEDRFPSSLPGQLKLIQSSVAGQLFDMRLYVPDEIQRRLKQKRSSFFESLLSADTPVLIVAENDAEIRAALDLIEQYQLKALLVGPQQLKPFVERMKSLGVGVVAKPVYTDDYRWYLQDLVTADQAGVSVCFAGDSAEQLRLMASQMVSLGMQPASALRKLCMGCKELAGDDVLSEGSPADLVVWSDSPVSLQSKPLAIIVDGKLVEMK